MSVQTRPAPLKQKVRRRLIRLRSRRLRYMLRSVPLKESVCPNEQSLSFERIHELLHIVTVQNQCRMMSLNPLLCVRPGDYKTEEGDIVSWQVIKAQTLQFIATH